MTTPRRLSWICFLAAVPALSSALAGNELWSVVQGITPGTQIEVQIKDVKHRGTLSAVTAASLSINTATAQVSLSQPEIRKVKVRKRNFRRRTIIGGLIGLAAGIAGAAPFGELGRNEGTFEPATAIGAGAAIGLSVGASVGALTALAPGYYTVYESATGP
jgi:hypothetical protein